MKETNMQVERSLKKSTFRSKLDLIKEKVRTGKFDNLKDDSNATVFKFRKGGMPTKP